ncbi:MAG: HD domain-containing protein [Muribaculaceae bacterium]|nr:HD domain-containing protein [Muribaculaceae bacterium]
MNESLKKYIESSILPLYDGFDGAHRRNHVDMVIEQSMAIAADLDVDMDMVYTIAAYHDTGLTDDRKTHHLVSGKILRGDSRLRDWFSESQIETMAQACEDHRASSGHMPRSIYGMIVAEADRFIDPDTIILRTVQYGLANYPELGREGHWQRTLNHLHEKYAEGGYLRLWFENSPNKARLNALREIIRNEVLLRRKFDCHFESLTNIQANERQR